MRLCDLCVGCGFFGSCPGRRPRQAEGLRRGHEERPRRLRPDGGVGTHGAEQLVEPAAQLAGDNALEKNFDLKEGGTADGIEWGDAQPKSQDSGFQFLRIGFVGDTLRAMELTDSFGQVTTIAFEKFERNPQLPASQFRFTPPKGADVLGE